MRCPFSKSWPAWQVNCGTCPATLGVLAALHQCAATAGATGFMNNLTIALDGIAQAAINFNIHDRKEWRRWIWVLSASFTTATRQGVACSTGMAGQPALLLPWACSRPASNVRWRTDFWCQDQCNHISETFQEHHAPEWPVVRRRAQEANCSFIHPKEPSTCPQKRRQNARNTPRR